MDKHKQINEEACRVIKNLGGTNATARLCEIQPSSVSDWRWTGIPKPWKKYFSVIKPEIFNQ
jgi:hypothetical protein